MTVYNIRVIRKDKTIVEDRSGPYYGSYFKNDPDMEKRCEELKKDENVFMTIINSSTVMG